VSSLMVPSNARWPESPVHFPMDQIIMYTWLGVVEWTGCLLVR
jgi:hypothetical protein